MSLLDIFKKNSSKEIILDDVWNLALPDDTNTLSQEIETTNLFTGFANVMPNPDPVLKKLGWNKDVEAYKELLSDPQLYGAIENNRKAGVTRLKTNIENPDCPKAEIEFFQKWFSKLEDDGVYDNLTLHALDTPLFGRMVFGTVWDTIDGKYLPTQVVTMPHELCKFDTKGNLMVSKDGSFFEYPEHPAKFIVLRHKPTAHNPYGEALLSRCFWNIKFKKDAIKLWGLYIDKFGIPVVTAKYNPAALAKAYGGNPNSAASILLSKLATMARNGVIVYSEGIDIGTMERKTTSSTDQFEKLIRICDEQNTKLLLGHSGATESTSGDKLSNDTTATDVRDSIIQSDKKYPEALFNQLIYWIHQFNFGGEQLPKFSLYAEEDVDFTLAERDSKLVPVMALSGVKLSKSYFIDNYGFKEEDLEVGQDTNPTTTTKNVVEPLNYSLAFHNIDQFPDQTLVDNFAEEQQYNSLPTDVLLRFVEDYVSSQKDYKAALKNLAKQYPEMNSDELQAHLTQIMFVADMIGRFSTKNEMENLNG